MILIKKTIIVIMDLVTKSNFFKVLKFDYLE